eukprot:1047436-Pleurochrysis_carterae.AAC.1
MLRKKEERFVSKRTVRCWGKLDSRIFSWGFKALFIVRTTETPWKKEGYEQQQEEEEEEESKGRATKKRKIKRPGRERGAGQSEKNASLV